MTNPCKSCLQIFCKEIDRIIKLTLHFFFILKNNSCSNKQLFYIKIRRCGKIANETLCSQMPN